MLAFIENWKYVLSQVQTPNFVTDQTPDVVFDPIHTITAEFENGTKFLRLGVAFTRYRHEKM